MQSNISPNVIFSLIIGVAMVLGVVVYNNLVGRLPSQPIAQEEREPVSYTNLREAITVTEGAEGELAWQATLSDRFTPTLISGEFDSDYQMPDTLTAEFSINLFTEMFNARIDGRNAEEMNAAIDQLTAEAINKTRADRYTGADISITNTRDSQTIRTYINNAADTFIAHTPQSDRTMPQIFSDIIERNSQSAREELLNQATQYTSMRDAYLALTVPRPLAEAHLALINAIEFLRQDLVNVANFHDDTLPGYVGYMRFNDNSNGLTLAMQNMGLETIRYQEAFNFDTDSALLFIATLPDIEQN